MSAAALAILPAGPLLAHEVIPGAPGLVQAIAHPLLAEDLVLVASGLALLVGADARTGTIGLACPVVVLGCGFGLAFQGQMLALPGLWWWPMAMAAVFGTVVASGVRVGRIATLLAAFLGAVVLGLGLPRERPHLSGAIEAGAGLVIAVVIAFAALALPQAQLSHPVVRLAGRIAGAWIAAIALLALASALR